jgi:ABC-2 type transport system ATP-binding protein
MLEAVALHKTFGTTAALVDVSLSVRAGEIYCLLGANGAGKSTTLNTFLGFVRPDRGAAKVGGGDVHADPHAARRQLAYIPETVMLYGNLSGVENLAYFAALSGQAEQPTASYIAALASVGLAADATTRRVHTYSKGMRQKVGIAIAISRGAKALLLDEPTSGLDPKASNEFSTLLRQLRDAGVAILMATHDLFRAKEISTRIGLMKHGRLVTELAPETIGHADLERIYLEHLAD